MTHDGDDSGETDGADPLLRAIAAAPDRLPPQAPTRIAHFRILRQLGKGGMGVVYLAEDEKLRRTVAVKVLPDTGGDDERRLRFLREARTAAAISHPNVAVVYAVDEADGHVYIAMELVEGENLRGRLERGRLDVATAMDLATQIARGLAAAHDKGIVHRDLKPENVIITPAGVVKLLDFGLAKAAAAPSGSGPTEAALARTESVVTSDEARIMGTPEYMSPEQALGGPLDLRSDVFSFGIVLYEMLSGSRPFGGRTTGAVLVAIARDEAPPLRAAAPEVDPATESIVMRCLAKAPAERFDSARDIVAALSGQVVPRSANAANPSRAEVGPIARTRSGGGAPPERARLAVAAAAALALIGVAAFMLRRGPTAQEPAATPAVLLDSAPASVAPTASQSATASPLAPVDAGSLAPSASTRAAPLPLAPSSSRKPPVPPRRADAGRDPLDGQY